MRAVAEITRLVPNNAGFMLFAGMKGWIETSTQMFEPFNAPGRYFHLEAKEYHILPDFEAPPVRYVTSKLTQTKLRVVAESGDWFSVIRPNEINSWWIKKDQVTEEKENETMNGTYNLNPFQTRAQVRKASLLVNTIRKFARAMGVADNNIALKRYIESLGDKERDNFVLITPGIDSASYSADPNESNTWDYVLVMVEHLDLT
jgi:hypothetical protein